MAPRLAYSLACTAACACATAGYPRHVVVDETLTRAEPAASRAPSQTGGDGRLDDEDRRKLEQILDRIGRSAGGGAAITLMVVPAAAADVSGAGAAITISADHVRWSLHEIGRQTVGETYLAFALAHELGHAAVPACSAACADVECEREADRAARRILVGAGYHVWPEFLDRLARKRLDAVSRTLARVEECGFPAPNECSARSLVSAAKECLSSGETLFRYALLLRDESEHATGDSDASRRLVLLNLREYESLRTGKLRVQAEACGKLAGWVPKSDAEASCIEKRAKGFAAAVAAQAKVEIPDPASPALRGAKARWQDDADWLLEASAGPSWGYFRRPTREELDGGSVRAMAMWEGGNADGPGVRVGYARFGEGTALDGANRATRTTVELVARRMMPAGKRFALLSDLGVGVSRTNHVSGSSRTSFVMSLDGRLAWAPVPRLELGAAVAYAFVTTRVIEGQSVSLLFTAAVHFGNYGERTLGAERARALTSEPMRPPF